MWTVAGGRVYVVGVGVNSLHVGYVEALGRWARARDVIAGEDAVKAGGVKYLPRLDAQTDGDYAAYKGRACFFNATARAVEGYVGMIFRRQPVVKFSTGGDDTRLGMFLRDVDMAGTPLYGFAKRIVGETVSVGPRAAVGV